MLTITSASGSATYWATVAQVVPVFALALVLELRRSASHWTVAQRWPRRIESAAHLVNAFLLFMAFGSALTALRERPEVLNAWIVSVFLLSSLSLLVLNPVYFAVLRANTDLIIAPYLLWRRFTMRSMKQSVSTARREFREIEPGLIETERIVGLFVAHARADAAEVGLLQNNTRAWLDGFLNGTDRSDERSVELELRSLRSLVEKYDAHPTVELAIRLRRIIDWIAHRDLARFRLRRAKYDSLGARIEEAEAFLKKRDLSPDELELVTNSIQRAGEEFIIMWETR